VAASAGDLPDPPVGQPKQVVAANHDRAYDGPDSIHGGDSVGRRIVSSSGG
jgi:hypothetical protein